MKSLTFSKQLFAKQLIFTLVAAICGTTLAFAGQNAGSALDFDGTADGFADRVTVPHNANLNLTEFTIQAWVYPTNIVGEKSIVSKGSGFGGGDMLFQLHQGRMRLFSGNFPWVEANTILPTNQWSHVAVVRDVTGAVSFYLNGEPDGIVGGTLAPSPGTGVFQIGLQGDACLCNEFVGRLEDVRVFNAALSEQAIENFMFSFDGTEPAVVSYWGLNEGAGQTVEDLHPVNTNDGVLGTTVAAEDIDPSWTGSNAPLASLTHNNNIAAIWAGQTQSALDDFNTGLDITDTGFLSDDGDDIIFGHDGTIFSEVSTNLPVGYAARWARVWEIQVSDEGFQGGTVLLFFNAEEAGATLYSFSTSSLALIRRPVGSPANFEVVPTNGITVNQSTATVDVNVGSLLPGEYTLAMVEPWVDVADPVAAAVGAAGSEGVSWGDFDNDGDEDIYIATFNLPAQLLRNDGNGTFTEVANSQLAGSGLLGIVGGWWGDYDNNGNLDLVMSANSNRLATGDGAGGFVSVSSPEISDSAGINHRGISWVDYDNDGDLDLYMLSASARSVLLRNDGSNTWVDVTPAALAFATNFSCFQAAWADFDQDGDADVYIVRNTQPGALVRNDGGGVFTDITPSNLGTISGSGNVNSAAWGYTSGDAYPDLLITGSLNCYLFRNDAGSGSFTNITPAFFNFGGRQGLWLDYNSDRRQDIFIVGSFTSNRLVENLGGAFADVTPPLLANAGIANKAAAAADYDNDGDVDIYLATTPPEPNRLFQNNLTKNWLKVKLVGTQSNRSGFGARVKADPDESPSNREVFSNSGRFSQNSLPVEFGFGSATSALVEVYWPSGIVQDLGSVPLNQTITVVETDTDGDGDGVGDSADSCPFEGAPAAEGRVDQDGDGCEDESGSFRALRYWDDSQFPLTYQTDAVGDPSLQNPSDFDALQFGFDQWLTAANRPVTGGDDLTRSGSAVVTGGDQVNSISFSDPSGFLPGVLAITPVTSAADTVTIGGTLYRPGQIIDADMKFNTLQFTFETFQGQGPPGSYDLASVAAHEFGHFFGISHSSVKSSTMFYVVPLGNGAVTLEGDDVAAAQRLYDQPSLSLTLEGTIFRGDGTTPVVGAGVFAISSATGDTLSMTTTNADGIYRLYDVPESFRVRVQPLDGSAEVNFLLPSYINAELGAAAETDFLAEFWDEASENNSDFGAPGFVMDPLTGPRTDGDIILNVDGTAPMVSGSNPANLATGVPITTALTMEFSEPIDKAYFASNPDISLTDATLGTPVGGAAAILEDGTLLVFTPSQALDYNQAYNWTVGPDIRDLSGNPLASAEVVTFTTEVQPPVSITSVTPSEVPEGGVLVISGTGFSSNVTDISVDFEDGFSKASGLAGSNSSAAISAQPFSASPDQIFVLVPSGAVSGDVSVLVAGQPVSNILQLTIVPPAPAPKANLISDISIGADVRKLAMTPDGDYAWIATSSGVAIVDAKPSSPNFSTVTPVTLPGGAVGVTMLPGGSHAIAVGPTQPRLRAIDADDASTQFATVVSDKDLPENPRGVVSVPGTSDALVVSASQVTLIDARVGPNFGTALRQWSHPGVLFRGDISVAADVDEAYAATTDGRVAVLGFATGENVVKTLQSGVTVREVAPLPTGQGFVSGDGTGVLRRFDDRGPLKNTLPLTGGYRGMTTTPDGSFVYAVNYVANRVDILDLQNNGLSLVDQFNTSIDPVDIATGSSGRFIYVTTSGSDLLQVFDTVIGPVVQSVFPSSGSQETVIAIAGSGFDPTPANNTVTIGGLPANVLGVGPLGNVLIAQQPDGVFGGPISVVTPAGISNTGSYRGVNRPDQGAHVLQFSRPLAGTPLDVTESPNGKSLAIALDNGTIQIFDADPTSTTFLELQQVLGGLDTPTQAIFSPDGKCLVVNDTGDGGIYKYDIVPDANPPVIDSPDFQPVVGTGVRIGMTPHGARLWVTNPNDFEVIEYDLDGLGTTGNTLFAAAAPSDLIISPRGDRLFLGIDAGEIEVHDIDPTSPNYLLEINTIVGTSDIGAVELAISPNGRHLAWVGQVSASQEVNIIDIEPGSPTQYTTIDGFVAGFAERLSQTYNKTGSILYVVETESGTVVPYDVSDSYTALPGGTPDPGLVFPRPMAVSRDDGRLYVGVPGQLLVNNQTTVGPLSIISGSNQVGIQDKPLAFPVTLKFGGSSGLQEGSPVRVALAPGSAGEFSSGKPEAFTAADANGLFSFEYTPGSILGQNEVQVQTSLGPVSLFFEVLPDTSLAAPQLLTSAPNQSTGPGVSTIITVDFSKSIDATTVNPGSFAVTDNGGAPVPGTYSFANRNRRIVFNVNGAFAGNTQYNYVLSSGLMDYNGNPLSNPGAFSFTTAPASVLELHAVDASSGLVGAPVVLSGDGFAPNPTDNTVSFNGTPAVITGGDPGALFTYVPVGATSGPVTVSTGAQTSNGKDFQVLAPNPPSVNTVTGDTDVPVSGQQIAVVPDGSRAYMTSPGGNSVVPILLSTQLSEDGVPVGAHPFGVTTSPNGDRIYVTNFLSNTVSVIDGTAGSSTFQEVLITMQAGLNPTGIASHPDGRSLYVCNYGDSTLSIFETDSTSASAYTARAQINTNSESESVVVTPDGGRVIIGTNYGLLIVDPVDGQARAQINTNSDTESVVVTPDGALAIVLTSDDQLLIIDILPGSPTEGQARAQINTNSESESVVVSPDGASVYVTNADGFVQVFRIVITAGSPAVAQTSDAAIGQISLVEGGTINVGENPNGMAFDPAGDGQLLVVNSGDNTVSYVAFSDLIQASLRVTPKTITLNNLHVTMEAIMEFPPEYDPANVDVSSVRLAGLIEPLPGSAEIGDFDNGGVQELKLKFNPKAVYDFLPEGSNVLFELTGLIGGEDFVAQDHINVARATILLPAPGMTLLGGSDFTIKWEPSPEGPADWIDIFFSENGGADWDTVAVGTPDDSTHVWSVPEINTTDGLLNIVTYKNGKITGVTISDEPFIIGTILAPPEPVLPVAFALRPAAPNPFSSSTMIRFDLPAETRVTARIFGLDGSLVRELVGGELLPQGRYEIPWDGRNSSGKSTGHGLYFIRVVAGNDVGTTKVLHLK